MTREEALALVRKHISNVNLKRMKEPAFARGVNREIVRECEKAGIPLEEFAALALQAMQGISGDLGL